jgi:hypothetical protein
MKNIVTGKYSPEQVMMTLSAIAYSSFDSVAALQFNLDEAQALEKKYKAIWWIRYETSLAYVVRNMDAKDEYALVIRGPLFQFGVAFLFHLYEGLDMASQIALPYSDNGEARIAAGIQDYIDGIDRMSCNGATLRHLVNTFPGGSKVYITGHSLGGTLASAYAVKLAYTNLVNLDIIPYTFAAPAAGNLEFADMFDLHSNDYLFSHSSRCVNDLDIIPYACHDLRGMATINYGGLKCPVDFSLCVDCLTRLLILSRAVYAQPALKLRLLGKFEPIVSFFGEAMYQHQHNTYLGLLGLNPINSAGYYYKSSKQEVFSNPL